MIASLGSLMTGSGTSSTEMSRKPCQVTAFISASRLAPVAAGQMRARLRAHLQHATVHDPRRTCHVTGLRTRQERDHRRNLARVAGPAEWDAKALLEMWILILLPGHGGCDLARSNGVCRDLVLAQLQGEGLDQSADAVLGGIIRAGTD